MFGYCNVQLIGKKSTHRNPSLILLRKIPSGKSFNWLFCNFLPTKIHIYCQLQDKKKIEECVLGGSILNIEHHGTENKNKK